MKSGYWFTSNLFHTNNNTEADTSLNNNGKALAQWLCVRLTQQGYDAEIIPEDWGWCIMCVADEYLLWVGCGAIQSATNDHDIVWHVFPEIEIPPTHLKTKLRRWMGKIDLDSPLSQLDDALYRILCAEDGISLCDEPFSEEPCNDED